jgi:hypothetical protein
MHTNSRFEAGPLSMAGWIADNCFLYLAAGGLGHAGLLGARSECGGHFDMLVTQKGSVIGAIRVPK